MGQSFFSFPPAIAVLPSSGTLQLPAKVVDVETKKEEKEKNVVEEMSSKLDNQLANQLVVVDAPSDASNQVDQSVHKSVSPDNTPAAFAAHLENHLYDGKPGPEIAKVKSRVLDLEGNRELWLVEWKDETMKRRIVPDDFLQSHIPYHDRIVEYFTRLGCPNLPGDFAALAEGMSVYKEGRSDKVEEITADIAPKLTLVKEKSTKVEDAFDFLFRDIPHAKHARTRREKPSFAEPCDLLPPSSCVVEDRLLSDASESIFSGLYDKGKNLTTSRNLIAIFDSRSCEMKSDPFLLYFAERGVELAHSLGMDECMEWSAEIDLFRWTGFSSSPAASSKNFLASPNSGFYSVFPDGS